MSTVLTVGGTTILLFNKCTLILVFLYTGLYGRKYYDCGSTHIGPSLPPVPGPAASRPDLTVLVAGGASLHLHVAPGERGDLGGGHVSQGYLV